MKKTGRLLLMLMAFLYFFPFVNAQQVSVREAFRQLDKRREIYFSVNIPHGENTKDFIQKIDRLVYIDKIQNSTITAYANKKQFEKFVGEQIPFQLLTPPSMRLPKALLDKRPARAVNSWDYYPTYQQYVDLMNGFANDYPNLCELVNIGQTVEGRDLLFIHINDSLGVDQNEPEFMYTATMHGDETTPYVLMLHLIDYLLSNYGTDDKVTNLVNNIDIWINPLANPDGTYAGGNNTVYGATRENGNGIDLNRNYPDPEDGPHPDGNEYQPETVAFMNLAEDRDFVLSCNMHTGAEVANYPWDTWSQLHADDDWWVYVCREYADTVHAHSPAGYFTDLDNGITNGYAWYSIAGGRQDYMNYFQNCREFTLELSETKMPSPALMPDYWEYNYRSFLNYMEQSLYGVRGIVTNKYNGHAVKAKVFAEAHDYDNSYVYSSLPVGNYHRPVKTGTYDLTFSAFGYYPQTIYNVTATDRQTTWLNVQLHPMGVMVADFTVSDSLLTPGSAVDFFDNSYSDSIAAWQWTFDGGDPASSTAQNPAGITYNTIGEYDVTLTITDTSGATKTTVKHNFIKVMNGINIADDTVTTCEALFFDDGGENGNYNDNGDFILTFVPGTPNSAIRVTFTRFALESSLQCSKDYLSVYDGSDTTAELIGTYCGTDIPAVFVGQNDGNLTFYFHSDESGNDAGWKAWVTCDTNVGIYYKPKPKVNIFPNPAKNFVSVVSDVSMKSIELFNLNGMLLKRECIHGTETKFALRNLTPGLYLIKINGEKTTVVKKLTVTGRY